ncbi:MAG: hypothetical protein BGO11_07515 [Solirubrobacterales bacterium 70-9]|nr:MAG: hypothetical protein BGO11_07515 [Solirubrobacterales bacterium 70-9]
MQAHAEDRSDPRVATLVDEFVDAQSHDPVGALRAAIRGWDPARRDGEELRPALARLDFLERRLSRSRAQRYGAAGAALSSAPFPGLLVRPRARHRARSEIKALAGELRSAGRRLASATTAGGPHRAEAAALYRAAEELEGHQARWRRSIRTPRRLEEVTERALQRGDPAVAEPPSFETHLLRDARLRRQEAKILDTLLVRCVNEARCHGRGSLQTIVGRGEGRAIFRMVNFPEARPVGGRGRGRMEFERLARALPGGSADFRGLADGEALGLGPEAEIFLAQFSFDLDVIEPTATARR